MEKSEGGRGGVKERLDEAKGGKSHCVEPDGPTTTFFNARIVVDPVGRVAAVYRKIRLPNYDVFDEKRYFDAGDAACVVTLGGVRCGINICADIWDAGAAELARSDGTGLPVCPNPSPCPHQNQQQRV